MRSSDTTEEGVLVLWIPNENGVHRKKWSRKEEYRTLAFRSFNISSKLPTAELFITFSPVLMHFFSEGWMIPNIARRFLILFVGREDLVRRIID
jgi:hypothetical protein